MLVPWALLLVSIVVAMLVAAGRDSAGGAVIGSLLACAYAVTCCELARRGALADPRPVAGDPSTADRSPGLGERVWTLAVVTVVLLIAAAFPLGAATHRLPGRGGGDGLALDFGDASPDVLLVARALGWLAVVIVMAGVPATYLATKRRIRRAVAG